MSKVEKVFFVGAGPGDPELLTMKGHRVIGSADVIIYAGSLVNPKVLDHRKESAEIHNSAKLTLETVIQLIKKAVDEGKQVARVHTGDPSLYGAIQEQMDLLDGYKIPYEVIPGVSSFMAAAAALKRELTLPDVTQTVILTRLEGRTPVPEKEALKELASHQASMAIFLSVHMMEGVVEQLLESYPEDTPIAVVQRASWPDEKMVIGTLKDIAKKVQEANITKTAQILVGRFLNTEYERSKLYDPTFSHEYREATK
ncbi:precorrin-4 C11-methyltransferase [Alkaliphilus metalliredigens QYMF]|uniref:Precorrin-4 C11-methyltransferase n=1 Tax=Alkaliphilus metalliredigens (strain QYMF) TaxID=293826 RepID=A6TJE9_ALKMQ|nr:precorrin-4 C11-methyltransferase [Alkaliphilus metalliredigens QYMF]